MKTIERNMIDNVAITEKCYGKESLFHPRITLIDNWEPRTDMT